jgi:hypothetical protein
VPLCFSRPKSARPGTASCVCWHQPPLEGDEDIGSVDSGNVRCVICARVVGAWCICGCMVHLWVHVYVRVLRVESGPSGQLRVPVGESDTALG